MTAGIWDYFFLTAGIWHFYDYWDLSKFPQVWCQVFQVSTDVRRFFSFLRGFCYYGRNVIFLKCEIWHKKKRLLICGSPEMCLVETNDSTLVLGHWTLLNDSSIPEIWSQTSCFEADCFPWIFTAWALFTFSKTISNYSTSNWTYKSSYKLVYTITRTYKLPWNSQITNNSCCWLQHPIKDMQLI